MAVFTGVELDGSDGNRYRFLGDARYNGGQWAIVNPQSGKTTRMATRKIALELNQKAGKMNYTTQKDVFGNLLLRGIRSGHIPARTQYAKEWFRGIAREQSTISTRDLLSESSRMRSRIFPGRMYFFQYYPKGEKTLPYYDTFPIIFPIKKYSDSYLGINFHYLPLIQRAELMDALYDIVSDDRFDERTKLRVSYGLLSKASQYKNFKPTIHKLMLWILHLRD